VRAAAGRDQFKRFRTFSLDPAEQRLSYSETRPAPIQGAKMVKLIKTFEAPLA
jgi:hypothetical protein